MCSRTRAAPENQLLRFLDLSARSDRKHPFILAQPLAVLLVVRHGLFHFFPETVRVIRLAHVNQFMDDHVIYHLGWGKDKTPGK